MEFGTLLARKAQDKINAIPCKRSNQRWTSQRRTSVIDRERRYCSMFRPGESSLRCILAACLACVMLLPAVPGFAGTPKTIDPVKVRAKVEKLGVGEHVMVKNSEGQILRGHITGIDQDAFKLHPDNTSEEILIAYDQVVKVRKNPGAFTWMLVGAILAVVIIVAAK